MTTVKQSHFMESLNALTLSPPTLCVHFSCSRNSTGPGAVLKCFANSVAAVFNFCTVGGRFSRSAAEIFGGAADILNGKQVGNGYAKRT